MVLQSMVQGQRDLRSLTIDLTSARNDAEYTIPLHPLKGMLFWCDGAKNGISIKIGEQSRQGIGINQVNKLPIYGDPWKIYVTNDIRQGRSILVIFFVNDDLTLDLTNLGDTVSNAELAGRLGSIDTFDRRGEVLQTDDFESGLSKWVKAVGGTGALIDLSAVQARNGLYSAKLVTGSAINNFARMSLLLPFANVGRFGFEFHFTIPDANVFLEVSFFLYDGTNLNESLLRFNSSTAVFQYLNSANALTNFATSLVIPTGDTIFHIFKLVSDFSTGKYLRAIWNSNIYDLSNFNYYVTADATSPQLLCRIELTTLAAANKTGYLDDVIITTNEP